MRGIEYIEYLRVEGKTELCAESESTAKCSKRVWLCNFLITFDNASLVRLNLEVIDLN